MTMLTFWASLLCAMLYGYAIGFGLLTETAVLCGASAALFGYWNAREVNA
jgi:hypothetical protein